MMCANQPVLNRQLVIDVYPQDGLCLVHVHGPFLTGTDPEYLRAKLEQIQASNCPRVLADFREVPQIGSAAVTFLVGMYTSAIRHPEGSFVLVGARARVREVLDVTRLSSVFAMVPDMATGLAMLAGHAPLADARGSEPRP